MNKRAYRLVFSRFRGMLVAVEETAAATGKKNQGETTGDVSAATRAAVGAALRSVLAATGLTVFGLATAFAQVVADPNAGAHRPTVIQTANGIQQVNVTRPSAAGVSINGYTQFDVPKAGVVLNNSPTIVNTQQAGYINGNPNFGANQSAKIIVNQVNSRAASQINGYVEVAGNRAEVVIANGSGISVNGGGFINTSRAILTTGTPNYGPDGSLTGFNVTGGSISIQGAGLNASNVDQVDLISRAVQANAAIYAKNLNVVTGANSVDHDTLNATPIAGDGPAPGVSIDVSSLGGMYANRIVLVGTENGVGVSNKGVLAAQAGDLVLTTQGKLVLAGQTNATGNISANARDGIDNSGTTYAQQNISASTSGALTNSGTLAAQQSASLSAASIKSGGTLGAGVNGDGTVAGSGNLALNASGSDIDLSGTTTVAGGALSANAAGTLSVAQGKLSSGGAMQLAASDVSNVGGQIVSQSALDLNASHGLANRTGVIQSAARASVNAGSIDNTAGRLVSLNGDGMSLTTTGALVNATGTTASGASGGVIGTNGALQISAGALSNQGQLNAASDANVQAQSIDNHAGNITAGGALDASAAGALDNTGGTLSSTTTRISAASIDNTNGSIDGDALSVSAAGNLTNRGGKLTQYGTTDQTIHAGGAFDNTGGAVSSNANSLTVAANSVVNDSGSIQHAGNGALGITTSGDVSNRAGRIVSNGALELRSGGALSNQQGTVQAAGRASLDTASLDNSAGRIVSLSGDGMNLTTSGALVNATGTTASGDTGGVIGTNGALGVTAGALSNHGQLSAAGDAKVHAQSLDNVAGNITAGGALDTTATGTLDNTGGTLSGSTTNVAAASINNTNGSIDGDALSVSASGDLTNRGGKLTQYGTGDQTIHAAGAIDNTGGTIASNGGNLSVLTNRIINDSGTIQHAGAGALTIDAAAAVTNASGKMVTNGALTMTAASLDNSAGTLSAQKAARFTVSTGIANRGGALYGNDGLTLETSGGIDSTGGSVQTAGNLTIDAGGQLSNAHGALSANGAHGTVSVSAASVDNTAGKLTNAGDGAMSVTSSTGVTNTGGTLGGNGDLTLNAQTLSNDAGANVVASGAANLNVTQSINNAGGTIYGGTALTINQAGATVTNNGGSILGGADASLAVASLANAGGAIRANRDIMAGGAISGNGNIVAGRDLTLNVAGDYVNTAANNLHADGNMAVNATGTLTNTGTLAANGALTVRGANVVNAAGADINSSTTTVNAAGTISNAGRIEGNSVTTTSATLANTGAVIGNDVTVNATDVQNTGAAAVIAGVNSVHVYAANSVTNADGALIYSAGNLDIARNGARDGSGLLANQTNVLTNSAASIEADGSIDIAAHTVNNVRTGVVTVAGAPQDTGDQTLTIWTAGIPIGDSLGTHQSITFSQWNWSGDEAPLKAEIVGKLATPISVTVPKSQVTNLNNSAQTFSLTQPLTENYLDWSVTTEVCNSHDFCHQQPVPQTRNIATNPTQWYNSIADNGDSYTITFWPDFDPNKNIRPDQVKTRFDLGPDSHDYSETTRTVHTTTTTDQLLSAGNAATIQAQGAIRINADGGAINNQSSTMSAGGSLVRRANGGTVNDTGIVLQQTVTQDEQSTFYWHQKTGGSSDTKTIDDGIAQSTTTVASLPAIATSNQGVQTTAQNITIGSVNRQGQTVIGSGVTGGSADGTQTGSVAGQSANPQSLSGAQAGGVTGGPIRPQTVGGLSGGIPNLKLPSNGLYKYNTAPGATYLVATDPRFTQYTNFVSSDYMLNQLGLDPSKVEKRVGDGMYEETLVRNQITQLTGRTFLTGYTDNLDEYTALMNNGVKYAKEFGLTAGVALTPEQMSQLTTDMVWLVSQDVTLPDGSHQSVLVPQVYLAQSDTVDLSASGALVAGNSVSLNASGDVNNSGHIVSDVATTIIGNNITNSGVIGSAGTTTVSAVQDVRNTSGRIGGADVVVQAGRDVISETQTASVSRTLRDGDFTSTATGTVVGPVATISATGSVAVVAGRDVTLTGANIQAGGDALVGAGRNLTLQTDTATTSQDVVADGGRSYGHDTVTQSLGSEIASGGTLLAVAGQNATFIDANVRASKDATLIAGGDLTLSASKDTHSHSEASLGGSIANYSKSSYDEAVRGTSVEAGNNVAVGAGQSDLARAALRTYAGIDAPAATHSKGNLTVLGSTIVTGTTDANGKTTGGGSATLAATGDITLGSVDETHVADSWSKTSHSGLMSHEETEDASHSKQTLAVGSLVSAGSVTAQAGNDLNVVGSALAATGNVALNAGHDVNIVAATETNEESSYHHEHKSGLSGSGGIGFSVGSSDVKSSYSGTSVTQSGSGSTVGSVQGNVSIVAGGDMHIGGSDIVAGKAAGDVSGATGNIALRAQNITIDPAHDEAQVHQQQESRSSGFTAGITGTPLDTARNLSKANDSGTAFKRAQGIGNELAASALDTPSVTLSYGSTRSSSSSDVSSVTNTGSTIRGAGNVTLTATGGAVSMRGAPIDGDITVTGSLIQAGGTATFDANHSVIFQASTDQYQQSMQSSSSSTGFQLASPSLGDLSRWVNGGPNSSGISPSPYNASSNASNGASASTQQNATVVRGNSVIVKSHTGDIDVIGSGISGTQGVDLIASQGSINVLAGTDTNSNHQEQSGHQFGSLGSNSTGTGFSVGVANSHSVQDQAGQTQSTIRSQIVSQSGNVTLDAKRDVTVQGSDLSAGKDLTLIGANLNLDPGTDAQQSSLSQSASQYGVTLALGGAAGNAVAAVNQATGPNRSSDSRLSALDDAKAALATYDAVNAAEQFASSGKSNQALVKATVSIGGGSSHSESQQSSIATSGSTLDAGGTVKLVATGSGAKDAHGFAEDGDINSRGTLISGNDVVLNAARDINLQSAQDLTHQSSSNSSSNASIGVGFALGGQQNGFTIELAASAAKGHANGDSVTNRDTRIAAADNLSITSGRDTNLRGAEVSGKTVDANVGRDLNIQSVQDTNTYDSKQVSGGFNMSICVPPICYGTTVSGSANVSDQWIKDNYRSVDQQSGIYAGSGGFNVQVGNHTQLDGGVIGSTATADKNVLSTQTFGYTNLENTSDYSGATLGLSVSGAAGKSTPQGTTFSAPVQPNGVAGASPNQLGPSGFGMAGVSGSQSGTTYAAVSAGTIVVRGDAGTGHDSTAGLSRDAASANDGAVKNTFDAQKVQNDMAVQQGAVQVGMQVVGDIATKLEDDAAKRAEKAQEAKDAAIAAGDTKAAAQAQADLDAANQQLALWGNDGAARIAAHAAIAGVGAALGGGNVAGAVGGTVAGDIAGNAVAGAMGDSAGGSLASNIASGLAGALAGGALGGAGGAMSGANGALGADLYNRQLHQSERDWAKANAKKYADFYKSQTGRDISEEDAYRSLLSAGYAIVDNYAQSTGGSDEKAKQFIAQNAAPGIFDATPEERAHPLWGGNADGSMTPEQQARWGTQNPSANGQKQYSDVLKLAQQPCADAYSCGAKVDEVTSAIQALQQEKALYGDDPAKKQQIEAQEQQLLSGVTSAEWQRAKLAQADQSTLIEVLGFVSAPALAGDIAGALGRLGVSGGKAADSVAQAGASTAGAVASHTGSAKGLAGLGDTSAVSPTASGYVNATKVCQSSCVLAAQTSEQQALVQTILRDGDREGRLTEKLINSIGASEGYTVLSGGKYGANNGFDHVFESASGDVTLVIDSKQINNGTFKLSPDGAGGNMQLSKEWIDAVLNKLDPMSPAYQAIERAQATGTLTTAIAGVDKTTGQIIAVPVKINIR